MLKEKPSISSNYTIKFSAASTCNNGFVVCVFISGNSDSEIIKEFSRGMRVIIKFTIYSWKIRTKLKRTRKVNEKYSKNRAIKEMNHTAG